MMIWKMLNQSQMRKKNDSLRVAEAEVGVIRQGVRIAITTGTENAADHLHITDEVDPDPLAVGAGVPHPIEDVDIEVVVDHLIVAIQGHALAHDRHIVGVTDPSLDQNHRRSRHPRSQRNQRNPTNRTRKRIKIMREQG